jgi:hypothetical protein
VAACLFNQPFGLVGNPAAGGVGGRVGGDRRTGVECETARGLAVAALRSG